MVLSTELGKLHHNSNNSGQMRPTQWAGAPMPALDPCLTCVRSGHGKFMQVCYKVSISSIAAVLTTQQLRMALILMLLLNSTDLS